MTSLLVLIAPPASGKTYWIESFARDLCEEGPLVVSPLRALADECRRNWGERIPVVTPEEWLLRPVIRKTIIFDEFHLNFYWGDTFRPLLWEVFYALSAEASLVVLLTATLSPEMKKEITLFKSHFEEIVYVDRGNRRLKHEPVRYVKGPSREWMKGVVEMGPRGEGVNLIFCPYRDEVRRESEKLRRMGFRVWSCVGGEAARFQKYFESGSLPDFIVATSVLGHGVNLPPISCVFFLYPLENIDFWVQMVARGGRKGERYEVFALENPHGIMWNRFSNLLAIFLLSFRMWVHSMKRDLDQWFLKESS